MKERNSNKGMPLILVVILILVIILAVILLIYMIGTNKDLNSNNIVQQNNVTEEQVTVLGDGTKLNTSSKLKGTKTIDGLEISNFQLTAQGSQTVLLGTVKNSTTTVQGGFPITITILDKQGNNIAKLVGYISQLKPGGEEQLNVSSTLDYVNAYDIKIEKQ
ncbi:MAG: FxLYD domain-containing protein [Oscillospiraceae bacterium]|nr:FxLYD domain-containing protein [Oscillospiraceae bacterium]